MRFRRIVGLLVAVTAAMILTPRGAASAAPYPVDPPPASVSDGTVPDGGSVTFSGTGFLPFEKISININYGPSNSSAGFAQKSVGGFVLAAAALPRRAVLTATADAKGTFSITVHLSQVGTATLVATGLTSGRTVTANVKVLGPPEDDTSGTPPGDGTDTSPGDDTALPTTGPSGARLLVAVSGGVGLVFLGAAILWYARSRRDHAHMKTSGNLRPPQ